MELIVGLVGVLVAVVVLGFLAQRLSVHLARYSMSDQDKTRAQLPDENEALRARGAESEWRVAEGQRANV